MTEARWLRERMIASNLYVLFMNTFLKESKAKLAFLFFIIIPRVEWKNKNAIFL